MDDNEFTIWSLAFKCITLMFIILMLSCAVEKYHYVNNGYERVPVIGYSSPVWQKVVE